MAKNNRAHSKSPINDLSAKYVRSILAYDKETGIISWKVNRPPRGFAKKPAGYKTYWGYVSINIKGQAYLAHRLAWLIVTGIWPKNEIDHISTNRSDNRWANLREATRHENGYHRPKDKRNTSGYKGARITKSKKYQAIIRAGGVSYCLGTYATAKEAHAVYCAAAEKLHKKFAHF